MPTLKFVTVLVRTRIIIKQISLNVRFVLLYVWSGLRIIWRRCVYFYCRLFTFALCFSPDSLTSAAVKSVTGLFVELFLIKDYDMS